MARAFIALIMSFSVSLVQAQSTVERQQEATLVPEKYIDRVASQSQKLEQALDKKSQKALAQLQKQENKIKKKLSGKIGSLAADSVLANTAEKYKELEEKLMNGKLTGQYISHLDTLVTSLKFLEEHKEFISQAKEVQEKLKESLGKINGLQSQLAKAEEIKNFLRDRKEFLQSQLSKLQFTKELKKISKQAYYFSEQLKEYRSIISGDPKKIERKALEVLTKTRLFREFMQKNSILASFFRINGDPNDPNYVASLAGLQTRSAVQQGLIDRFGAAALSPSGGVGGGLQQAQTQLSELKNKVMQFGGGSSDDIMPEGFSPNTQRTKSFWKKWEVGVNAQSNRANAIMPVSSDLGIYSGFRPNNWFIAGIGFAGRIGWGKDIRHIAISYSGISARSFAEFKLKSKGSFHAVAGFEMNYRTEIKNIDQLRNYSAWGKSGLLGVSKVLSIKSKLFKKTKMQVLWDWLSYQQIPRTQPVLFRINYEFK
jgi:hypothetical protein